MASLAGGYIGWLGNDADKEIADDFRIGNARKPEVEQFRVGQAPGRAKQRVVYRDVRVVKVKEHAVMARAGLGLETMIKDGRDAGIAAEPKRAQRIARLHSHGGKTAADGVSCH